MMLNQQIGTTAVLAHPLEAAGSDDPVAQLQAGDLPRRKSLSRLHGRLCHVHVLS
jgi:hypothetical protein